MANADLGSLDFKLIIDDKEFNKSVDAAIQKAKSMNASISQLLDLRKQYNATTKEDVTNARNSNRILREENKTREMNRREIIRTRKELVKLNAERAKAGGMGAGSSLAAQQSMLSNITNLAMKYVSIWGAASLIKNIASVTAEFELQRIALQAMIADTAKANQVYNQIWDLALKSPFNAKELVTYAKQLVAYSIPVNELFETTKMLADVSAGLGVGMDRLVLAYGQIRSASFLRGQEVRQLTEAGIPILEELRKQFVELGEETITVGDVFDKISKRLVPFEMVEKVFKNMTSEGGKFYQMQEVQAETLKGKLMILKDAYDKMFAAIGEKNKSTLKSAVEWATSLARNYDKTMGVLKSLVAAYGAYKVALELALLGEKAMLVADTVRRTKAAVRWMKSLGKEVSTLGVLFSQMGEVRVKKAFATLAGAIAMVATAIIVAVRNAGALERELKNIASVKFTEAQRSVDDFARLAQNLEKATKGSQKYRDAITALNNKYGEYLPNLLNEINAQDQLKESYDRVTNAIYSQAKAYAYEEGVRKLEEKSGAKMTDAIADVVNLMKQKGYSADVAQIFARNLSEALGRVESTEGAALRQAARNVWKETFGEEEAFLLDLNQSPRIGQVRNYIEQLAWATKEYNKAEEKLNDALDARFDKYAYKTVEERNAIKPVLDEYAKTVNTIESSAMTREETEEKLMDARKAKLKGLIKVYEDLNKAAKVAGKEGLWDNQIRRYTNELNALQEPDLTWLQKIVNPLIDPKNRDLKPQASDTYEEYVDNLRNIYKKQVTAVSDLSDTYKKYLDLRKKGIKDEDNAYFKSKDLYELEKKRKETIEAIGKALGISVDDKITGNSGKSAEQIRLETQINTLKDMEKWYDKLKDLDLGEDTIRNILKSFFPDQEVLTTTKSFRDELMRLADALAKYDEKAAQAIRDDVAGYKLDDYVDSIKKALEATKKLDAALAKLRDETEIEGTGVVFDVTKIVHDFKKSVDDINKKGEEAWDAAFKSAEAGNVVNFGNILKETTEYNTTQTHNALAKATDAISEQAKKYVEEWAQIKGVNLDNWSDMTIAQLNGVRDALKGMFDEEGTLIADEEKIEKIKESLSTVPGGWDAFVKALKAYVGVGEGDDISGLLKKLEDMTDKEKVKTLKYAAQSISELAESLIELGDASGSQVTKNIGAMIRDVGNLATDIAEGFAAGSWVGAAVAALKNIGNAILQNAAATELQNMALEHTAKVTAKLYEWDKNIELASGNVFGNDDLKRVQELVTSLNELNKSYSTLIHIEKEAQDGMLGLSEATKNYLEGMSFTTDAADNGAFGWITKFFNESEYTNIKDLAKKMGYSLYDEYGYLNAEFLKKVLEVYSDDLNAAEEDWLNSAIEYSEKANEYIKSINDSIENLVGSVADNFADSIVNQWIEAGDAAADYADILDEVARAYAKMMVQNVLMETVFTKDLQDQLVKATASGNADEALQLLDDAMAKAESLGPVIQPILEKLDKWFVSDNASSLGQGIKGVTEDTANLLASYINGMRADLAAQRVAVERIASNFEEFWKATYHPTLDEYLHSIEANTFDTAQNTSQILRELQSVIISDNGSAVRVAGI